MRNLWKIVMNSGYLTKMLGPCRLYPLPKGQFEPFALLRWPPQAALLECRKSLKARENPDVDLTKKMENVRDKDWTWLIQAMEKRWKKMIQPLESMTSFLKWAESLFWCRSVKLLQAKDRNIEEIWKRFLFRFDDVSWGFIPKRPLAEIVSIALRFLASLIMIWWSPCCQLT